MVRVPCNEMKHESMNDVMFKEGPKPSSPGDPRLWPCQQFASD